MRTILFCLNPLENGGSLVYFYDDGTATNETPGVIPLEFYWRWEADYTIPYGTVEVTLSKAGVYTAPGPLGVWQEAGQLVQRKYREYLATLILGPGGWDPREASLGLQK